MSDNHMYGLKPPNPLERIAFWQFLGFVMLLLVIWANHALDLADVFFGVSQAQQAWMGSAILSTALIIVGFVTVSHTFVQQRHVLHGLLSICSYCKRIKLDNQKWEQMERYVADRSRADFSHGICPDCFRKEVAKLNTDKHQQSGDIQASPMQC